MRKKTQPVDFKQGLKLTSLLALDLKGVTNLRGKIDEQLFRRIVVRTLFSLLDAFAYQLKSRALVKASYNGTNFNPRTLEILEEGTEIENDDGIRWKPRRPPTKENLKTALRAFAEANGIETPLASSHALPAGYDTSLHIRNRIAHPKRISQMEISDTEAVAIAETAEWFAGISEWTKQVELQSIQEAREHTNRTFDELRESILQSGEQGE